MKKIRLGEVSSCFLHIMAMLLMLGDHLWATVLPAQEWLTCLGRLAFPIFAFLIVEGYAHTSNIKNYIGRMFLFAVISEIPFNLVLGGTVFYPVHQNVLWTFGIALLFLCWIEKVKGLKKLWIKIPALVGIVMLAYVVGAITMVDYFGVGVLTVFVFYFFRGRKWWCFLGQLVCMYILNVWMLCGYVYTVTVGGWTLELEQQGFAVLALIPIWLYRGKQGWHTKGFRFFCYAFYPGHLLILYLIWQLLI